MWRAPPGDITTLLHHHWISQNGVSKKPGGLHLNQLSSINMITDSSDFFVLFCFVLTVLFHLNSNISTTFWGRLIHRVTVSVLGSSNQLFIFDRLCELPLRFLTFGSYINWALNLLILLNLPTQCSRGSGDLGVKEAGLCLCWCAQSRVWSRAVLQLFMYVVDFPFKINVKKLSVYSSQ